MNPASRVPLERAEARRTAADAKLLSEAEAEASLFVLVERWLERTPFLDLPGYRFWQSYRDAVDRMLEADRSTIEATAGSPDARAAQLAELQETRSSFDALFDETVHARLVAEGRRRMSLRATLAALLIHLYRDQPILHLPFRFLTTLVDIDELLATWRYRHAQMVHRMIGSKIGTGGSPGHRYLLSTVERHRVFADLDNLSTFLISRRALPALPADVERRLGFYYPRD